MAVSKDDLLISIQADTKDAVSGIRSVVDQMSKLTGSAKNTEESLTGFGFAAVKLHEGLALAREGFEALSKVWESTVGKFREAQDNVTRLSGSLSLMGERDVKGATESMVAFAESLQNTTVLSKDQAINLLSLGKAAGQSNEMSEKLVKTATDLAAATGEDVQTAFQGLVSTLKGHARGVGEASIFIRNLTEDELKAGKGVDVLAARMKGFAKVQAETFGGAAKQTANKLNEVFVQIGGIISRGLNLDSTGKKMLQFVDSILKKIEQLKPTLESALRSVRAVFDGIIDAIAGIDFKGIAEQAKYFAAVVAVALLPVLIPIAGSVAGIAAGFIAAAAPILATVAAVTALGLAFDVISRNIEIIPKIFMDEWRLAISTVKEMLLEMLRSVLGAAAKAVSAISTFIPGLGDIGAKAQESLKGFTDSVDKSLDDVGMNGAGLFQKLADDSQAVDFGLAGKLKDQLGNIVNNFKKSFAAAKEAPLTVAGPKLPTGEAAAPEQFRSKIKLFSDEDIKEIKNAFGDGVGQFGTDVNNMTSGFLQFAGSADIMLNAAQKMVDLIPGLIDKATHLIESITDFPNKLATSIQNFAMSIEKFVANFVPNVIKGVEKIADVLSTLYEKLPDIFGAMVEKLPGLLIHFIDKIPTFVSKFIIGFITQMPKVAIALTIGMVKGMPQVAKELIRVIVTELPPAIVKAIVEAVKEIGDALLHGFKGISLDTGALTNGIKAMAKTLTDESSKLFQVVDASAAARGQNTAQAIADAIDSSLNRAVALLRALWAALKAIWQWVYDHILMPIINAIRAVWQWVYDNILSPIITALKAVWEFIWNAFLNPMIQGIQAVWTWVYNNLIAPISSIITGAWEWVFKVMGNGFGWINTLDADVTRLTRGMSFVDDLTSVRDSFNRGFGFVDDLKSIADKLSGLSFGGIGGGGGGGGGIGGTGGQILSAATGGILEHGGPIYAATGKFIQLVPRGSDRTPIMAQDGEFVLNRRSVSSLGIGNLAHMNAFGSVPNQPSGPTNIDLKVNIEHHGTLDDSTVKSKIVPEMLKQLKKASTEGRFVLSDRGLRNV